MLENFMQTMIDREKEIFNLHTTIIEQANKLSKAWETFQPLINIHS